MNCDEVELELITGEAVSTDAERHLEGCPGCRAFRADTRTILEAAKLPELSPAERAALMTLEPAVTAAWRERSLRRWPREYLRLALAAGLGAVLASAALLSRPVAHPSVAPTVAPIALAEADEANLLDDEVFQEVQWPDDSLEGETP